MSSIFSNENILIKKIIGHDQIKFFSPRYFISQCFFIFYLRNQTQPTDDNKLFILLPEKIEKIINVIGE